MPIMKSVEAKFTNGVANVTMLINDWKTGKALFSVIIEVESKKRGCVRSEYEFHFSKDAHEFMLKTIHDLLV